MASTIDGIKTDKYALIEAANFLATDTTIKKRDLDAAQVVADKLKALPGTKDDPDSLAAMAAVSAGRGNYADAAEVQYDAWMAAAPAAKPAFKRSLDTYEAKAKDPKAATK
jgi:hypothetical protein